MMVLVPAVLLLILLAGVESVPLETGEQGALELGMASASQELYDH